MAEKKKEQPAKKKEQPGKKKKPIRKKKTEVKAKPLLKTKRSTPTSFPIVGLGASAGGLEALEGFFSNMPADSGMAFVVIQHLSPTHKSIMDSLLSKVTSMKVATIEDEMVIEPNCIYLNPPGRNVVIQHHKLHLLMPIKTDGVNLPIDCFFKSMAVDLNEKAVCIILSGTATDGTLGLKAVKGSGGLAMVQDPDFAKYDGMPRSAIATGAVDFVLPVDQLPKELIRYVKAPYITATKTIRTVDENFAANIQTIFALIRRATGHDLSHYKPTTINRRIERRMAVHQVNKISDYVTYLEQNPAEVTILFKDMLIGVTSFFRDAEAFKILQEQVLPELLKHRNPDSPIRIWCVGCSTGEEAYSLAILLLEVITKIKKHFQIQVFASDIDADAIEHARAGIYPDSIAADVSQERLDRYFVKSENSYRIKKQIRELVIFAVQNVVKDPPFSNIDLVSCRNLLIYMDAPLQKKVMPLFHYTLRQNGLMLLGTSESIGEFTDLFRPFDSKWKIFRKLESFSERALDYPITPFFRPQKENAASEKASLETNIQSVAERVILSDYAPPGVLVNQNYEIVHFLGKTDRYLEMPMGKASFNVLSMAREGLRFKLSATLHSAARKKQIRTCENVRIKYQEDLQTVRLTVRPLFEGGDSTGFLLVLFEEKISVMQAGAGKGRKGGKGGADSATSSLEQELDATREHLQTTIEELETSNEELKSINEEMQSVNEELQSTNEELETSKEELQSTNEELVTVNTELQSKLNELSQAHNDINNLLASTEIGTIFLDSDLKIKRFTPEVTKIFNLIMTDVGRSISDITTNIPLNHIYQDMQRVLKTLEKSEGEVQDKKGEWYSVRIMAYRTLENVIDGVVLTFLNISEIKNREKLESEIIQQRKIEKLLRERTEKFKTICENTQDVISRFDKQCRHLYVNSAVTRLTGFKAEDFMGKTHRELGFPAEQCDFLESRIKQVFQTGHVNRDQFMFDGIEGPVLMDWLFNPEFDKKGDVSSVLSNVRDIKQDKGKTKPSKKSKRK